MRALVVDDDIFSIKGLEKGRVRTLLHGRKMVSHKCHRLLVQLQPGKS